MAQRKTLPVGTHVLQAWWITPPDGRSEWDLPFKKMDPEVNRWRHLTGGQCKWTRPVVEKKSHPPTWWHLGLDITIYQSLSTYGAQSFLTVSVLSLSLSLIILANFFFFVVVLVCLLRFLFCIWCECKSDDWGGMTSNSMFPFLCICCFGMWLLIINI